MSTKVVRNPKTGMLETVSDWSGVRPEDVAETRRKLRDMLSGNIQFVSDNWGWTSVLDSLPPEGVEVSVKIDDDQGLRNCTTLIYNRNLWWTADYSVYVYWTPTHWKHLARPAGQQP